MKKENKKYRLKVDLKGKDLRNVAVKVNSEEEYVAVYDLIEDKLNRDNYYDRKHYCREDELALSLEGGYGEFSWYQKNGYETYLFEELFEEEIPLDTLSDIFKKNSLGQIRGLAFYKESCEPWTLEEYKNIVEFCGDDEDDNMFNETAEYIYDFTKYKEGFMFSWSISDNEEELQGLTKVSYESVFNKQEVTENIKEETESDISATPETYYIMVEGGSVPKYKHSTLKSATSEAKRLAGKEIGKLVTILKEVEVYQAKVIVDNEIVETENDKLLKQKDKELVRLRKEIESLKEMNKTQQSTWQKKYNKLKAK